MKKIKRLSIYLCTSMLLVQGISINYAPNAEAYTLTGCTWPTSTKAVNVGTSLSAYKTSLTAARNAWNSSADFTFTSTTSPSTLTATTVYASSVDYEGITTYSCSGGIFSNVVTALNTYYANSFPANKKKAVWIHELGHSIGVGHATSKQVLMWESASYVYINYGHHTPRPDDINAVNFLY